MVIIESRVAVGSRGEDRVLHRLTARGGLVALADGAGGTGNGAVAATLACERLLSGRWMNWATALAVIDQQIATEASGGTTTAVVVEVIDGEVRGASVGDSCAWLLTSDGIVDLTERQQRKPLLGSGLAAPTTFEPTRLRGRLLVATDGLFKYATRSTLAAIATTGSRTDALEGLIAAVRLRSGALQDDVAVALCEDAG